MKCWLPIKLFIMAFIYLDQSIPVKEKFVKLVTFYPSNFLLGIQLLLICHTKAALVGEVESIVRSEKLLSI